MNIINKKIDEIIPYEKNPRKNDEAVKYVAESIKQFGFKVPIVIDKNNIIVAGHTRYKASKELGLKEVPCIVADDLNEEQIKAFRLADNKVSEKSEWDLDLLEEELEDIVGINMEDLGFIEEEEKEKEAMEEGEVPFTEIVDEESNYLILKFDNSIDWLQLESFFELKPVQAYSTRKDGVITDKMKRIGVGRVLDGTQFFKKILGGENKNEN